MKLSVIAVACAPGISLMMVDVAAAQNYPEKSVTIVAPFPAGGSVDLVARAVAQQMSELWKQPVIVANRPGASGTIGVEAVVRAAPDGYTLLMGTTALSTSKALYPKLSFDPATDLAPVSLVVTMTNLMCWWCIRRCRRVRQKICLRWRKQNPACSIRVLPAWAVPIT